MNSPGWILFRRLRSSRYHFLTNSLCDAQIFRRKESFRGLATRTHRSTFLPTIQSKWMTNPEYHQKAARRDVHLYPMRQLCNCSFSRGEAEVMRGKDSARLGACSPGARSSARSSAWWRNLQEALRRAAPDQSAAQILLHSSQPYTACHFSACGLPSIYKSSRCGRNVGICFKTRQEDPDDKWRVARRGPKYFVTTTCTRAWDSHFLPQNTLPFHEKLLICMIYPKRIQIIFCAVLFRNVCSDVMKYWHTTDSEVGSSFVDCSCQCVFGINSGAVGRCLNIKKDRHRNKLSPKRPGRRRIVFFSVCSSYRLVPGLLDTFNRTKTGENKTRQIRTLQL